MDRITIRRPDDMHVHFRRGEMLRRVVPFTAKVFGRAVVMPNTSPDPVLSVDNAAKYYWDIKTEATLMKQDEFEPLMTIQITDDTTPAQIKEAKALKGIPIVAGKIYPKGVTTNSQNGVTDFKKLFPVFGAMESEGMVLSLHGQKPDVFCLDREREFLDIFEEIVRSFPRLKVVLEHISTKESVSVVAAQRKGVAATITAHHLTLDLGDVLSWKDPKGREGLNPHHYCQPILQRPEDRRALVAAALSGNPKFFFGSDTAPHLRETKESSCGCAGVFSAPVLLPVLAEFFTGQGLQDYEATAKFERFVSESGANFYGLPPNGGSVTIARTQWQVPEGYACGNSTIVPLAAGRTLEWKVVE